MTENGVKRRGELAVLQSETSCETDLRLPNLDFNFS